MPCNIFRIFCMPTRLSSSLNSPDSWMALPKSMSLRSASWGWQTSQRRQTELLMNRYPLTSWKTQRRHCNLLISWARTEERRTCPSDKNRARYWAMEASSVTEPRKYLVRKTGDVKFSWQPLSLRQYWDTFLVILWVFPSRFLPPILISKMFGWVMFRVRFSRTMNSLPWMRSLQREAKCCNQSRSSTTSLGVFQSRIFPKQLGRYGRSCQREEQTSEFSTARQNFSSLESKPFKILVEFEKSSLGAFPET